jgi:hypothetical protein
VRTVCFPKRLFEPAALVDERGCRRDIRSNGCTALFDRACSFRKAVRQKKQVFFIGADPKVRNFTGAPCRLKFGPDVFADALVPRRGIAARRFDFPKIAKFANSAVPRLSCRGRCGNGYRFAKRQGKPNSANGAVIQQNKRFAVSRRSRREIRSDSIHREA